MLLLRPNTPATPISLIIDAAFLYARKCRTSNVFGFLISPSSLCLIINSLVAFSRLGYWKYFGSSGAGLRFLAMADYFANTGPHTGPAGGHRYQRLGFPLADASGAPIFSPRFCNIADRFLRLLLMILQRHAMHRRTSPTRTPPAAIARA